MPVALLHVGIGLGRRSIVMGRFICLAAARSRPRCRRAHALDRIIADRRNNKADLPIFQGGFDLHIVRIGHDRARIAAGDRQRGLLFGKDLCIFLRLAHVYDDRITLFRDGEPRIKLRRAALIVCQHEGRKAERQCQRQKERK